MDCDANWYYLCFYIIVLVNNVYINITCANYAQSATQYNKKCCIIINAFARMVTMQLRMGFANIVILLIQKILITLTGNA